MDKEQPLSDVHYKLALTVEEAAELSNTGIGRIRAAIHAGELRAKVPGKEKQLILRADLDAWLESLPDYQTGFRKTVPILTPVPRRV